MASAPEKPSEKPAGKSLLEKWRGTPILVIGDVGIDEYVMGGVRRISPEAPVPILEVESEDVRLGLSANVAQNITGLGGSVCLVSVIGEDKGAEILCGKLRGAGVGSDFLTIDKSRPTTRKLRVMSGQHHIVRVDYEIKKLLPVDIQEKVLKTFEAALSKCRGVVIQDYAKGVLSEVFLQDIIKMSKKKGVPVLVDPHRSTPARFYQGADLMTPNKEEAILLSGRSLDDIRGVTEGLAEVGQDLMRCIGSEKMIITRGKEGVSLFEGKTVKRIPTFARQVFDVTGAGDTMIAALGLAWVSGLSLEDSCWVANHAAGVVVGKVGCVPCTIDDLLKSMA